MEPKIPSITTVMGLAENITEKRNLILKKIKAFKDGSDKTEVAKVDDFCKELEKEVEHLEDARLEDALDDLQRETKLAEEGTQELRLLIERVLREIMRREDPQLRRSLETLCEKLVRKYQPPRTFEAFLACIA